MSCGSWAPFHRGTSWFLSDCWWSWGLSGQDSFFPLLTPISPKQSVPLSSIYILKFQGKICLRKISAAKQKFKNTWPTLTHSFLSKCAIERASTLLKVAQWVSWRPCQSRAVSWFPEQWLFAKPLSGSCFLVSSFQGLVFSPQVATWRMYFAHISQSPSFQHASSQSPSTPPMSASDLGAPPPLQMVTGAPNSRQTDPGTTLLLRGKSRKLTSWCWLHLSLCRSDLSSERREGWQVHSVNRIHLRNAKPTVFGNSGQQPGTEPAKFQLGWEGWLFWGRISVF